MAHPDGAKVSDSIREYAIPAKRREVVVMKLPDTDKMMGWDITIGWCGTYFEIHLLDEDDNVLKFLTADNQDEMHTVVDKMLEEAQRLFS
jgi:hypothetical protein